MGQITLIDRPPWFVVEGSITFPYAIVADGSGVVSLLVALMEMGGLRAKDTTMDELGHRWARFMDAYTALHTAKAVDGRDKLDYGLSWCDDGNGVTCPLCGGPCYAYQDLVRLWPESGLFTLAHKRCVSRLGRKVSWKRLLYRLRPAR